MTTHPAAEKARTTEVERCAAAVYVSYNAMCGGAKRHRCTREATTVHKHGMPVCEKHKLTSLDYFPEDYRHE